MWKIHCATYRFLTEAKIMPRGSKSKYTTKQKRMAKDIEKGYEKRGTPEKESERRAWATVNKKTGGGKKGGGATPKKAATRAGSARKATTGGLRGKATTATSRKQTRTRSRSRTTA
jgi:hypothetical protein